VTFFFEKSVEFVTFSSVDRQCSGYSMTVKWEQVSQKNDSYSQKQ